MKKQVLRVYDKKDKEANNGECYFLIMPDEYDPNNDWHYEEYLLPRLCQIASLQWQNYTSYIEGTADVEEDEMFWSEITHYDLYECKIDISRVTVTGRYTLPEFITYRRCY